MNQIEFQEAIDRIVDIERQRKGIGTLSEKTLHAILKEYFEPHSDNHEVKIGGYVADIVGENGIIEIQTGNFQKLYSKLSAFLEAASVTVVYPIAKTNWINWVDNDGIITSRRKSPKRGNPFMTLYELYWLKELITHENLRIVVTMLETEEYRRLDGWSRDKHKGASKIDRIPSAILEQLEFNRRDDYITLIPQSIINADSFTAKELCRATKGSQRKNNMGLHTLMQLGLVERIGKDKNAFLYKVTLA